ncbi:UNVERIFIED_CONTAM: hypothetical protein RMT77_014349 [Armadillidium vulgare]
MNNFVKIYGMGFLLVLFLSVVSSAPRKIYQPPDLENSEDYQYCLKQCKDLSRDIKSCKFVCKGFAITDTKMCRKRPHKG